MRNISSILRIAKPLYHLMIALVILILINAALALVAPILSKFIVDDIVAQIQHSSGNVQRLGFFIGLAFVINLLSITITAFSERLGDHFAGRLRKFLTEKFYHKVLTLPQSYFDGELSGKIVNQLTRGILSINNFMNTATNFIVPTFLQSIFTIGVMWIFSPSIAIFTAILFPIYLTISFYSSVRWGREEVKKNTIEDSLRGRIQESIGNIKLVKAYTSEREEYTFVEKGLSDSNTIYARQSRIFHILDFFRNLSLNIILLLINIVVFSQTFRGNLTIGEMVLILQLVDQARRPLFAMSFILTQIQYAEAGSKEFFEIINLPSSEFFDTAQKRVVFVNDPSVSFEHVSFQYDTSREVLSDVTFSIKPRQTVALVGHSGAGKSTIVNLICKFYDPTGGIITLNNHMYKDISHDFVRRHVGLVFQENELFSSTIRKNVAYGTKASTKQIIDALKRANAYGFVKRLLKGLDSKIGERGVRLSGGQKQRIQIARAILRDAPILILDEATSSLDSRSEVEVQKGLENLMKGRLVVVIAHRFSTIQNVDQILVLDDGKIVDKGNPKDLAERKGIYRDLLRYQVEGNRKLLEKYEIY
ncbi:hypothetical protein A2690_04925 [Candidatus Roizmanbacteria bacterium RIFCSPHIGHO2_01_FULL_39_12b]|uniref:Iron ABC transporter ATP-binding protein n=1 Tax=Candidatus Roizmanbacteria bacterium RIFCSPHIGHO2_01_FULL_39_12b TaxID=1802030 RepID=A0A1F7GCZ4_9BACT|nr:MAG: hypothetical protein A2690_04925 [Candidatus Roizmanbacteria bacterium RIFCSPHIGHO2_01_FULL_39_12b]